MKLIVNGETKEFREGVTILEIMQTLAIEGKVMAAAINMEVVKQEKWDTFKPVDGDKLEMLDFVGGG